MLFECWASVEDADPTLKQHWMMPRVFWETICRWLTGLEQKLHSETQVSGRLGMSGGISPRHAQNPLSGERRKTLSITHHALSPPPSHHHHLYNVSIVL